MRSAGSEAAQAPPAQPESSHASGYEPPRLERLGTMEELTAGTTSGSADFSALFSIAVSDRRLKDEFAAIDRDDLLHRVASLPIRSRR
jgi:hypothetical protein